MSDHEDRKLSAHEEAWLDRMLDAAPSIEPSASLRRAVAEIPLRNPQPRGAQSPLVPSFVLGWAFAALVLIASAGVWAGLDPTLLPEVALGAEHEEPQASDDAELSAEPWQELSYLAFADDLDQELVP